MAGIEAVLTQSPVLTAALEGLAANGGENGATFIPSVAADGTLSWTNDKGLENPEPVNITGPAGADGAKGDKGDTGAQGAAGAAGSDGEPGSWHRNLLDNWYFADPINQRGQTVYTEGSNRDTYFLDRWETRRGDVEIVDGGISVTTNSVGTDGYIFQQIEMPELVGQTITISAIVDGELLYGNGIFPALGQNSVIKFGDVNIFMQWTNARPYPVAGVGWSDEGPHIISSIKLELGSVSTLAGDPPPSKALELAKCQRYFQVIKNYSGMVKAYSTTVCYALVPLACPMREAPAIGSGSTAKVAHMVSSADAQMEASGIARYSSWNTGGSIMLKLTLASAFLTEGEVGYISEANIILDANL